MTDSAEGASRNRPQETQCPVQQANEALLRTAFLYGANAGYIEELQSRYEQDPASVDAEWQAFFAG